MIISFKMLDGSRIDIPATYAQKEAMIGNLMVNGANEWFDVFDDGNKNIILRGSNIVSITIKGESDDSKTIS